MVDSRAPLTIYDLDRLSKQVEQLAEENRRLGAECDQLKERLEAADLRAQRVEHERNLAAAQLQQEREESGRLERAASYYRTVTTELRRTLRAIRDQVETAPPDQPPPLD